MRQWAQTVIQEIPFKRKRRIYLLRGWLNTGRGCPQSLWSLNFWRYSKPRWTQPWVTCYSWPCFEQSSPRESPEVPFNLRYFVIPWNVLIRLQQYLKEGEAGCKSLCSSQPEPAVLWDPNCFLGTEERQRISELLQLEVPRQDPGMHAALLSAERDIGQTVQRRTMSWSSGCPSGVMRGPDPWGYHSRVQGHLQSPNTSLQLWRSLLDCYNHLCAIQHSHISLGVRTDNETENCRVSILGGFQNASDWTKPWAICSDLRVDPALSKKLV